ncbi:MAG: DUF4105 domain-containing protein [Gemmatimonadota bacterium]
MLLSLAFAIAVASSPQQVVQEPGSNLSVYLVTFGQGDEIYERFGHNAIWIRDPDAQTDIAYNWGEFNFDQPGFYRRFLMGRMIYEMRARPMADMIYAYQQYDRSIWAQELNLTPAQKRALHEFVIWNEQPENKDYRYDYYRDNCSTRVRDALDRALGGALKRALLPRKTDATYRSHTKRLMIGEELVLTGMNLAMGPAIDQPLTLWEEAFIPMELQEAVRLVTVSGPNGETVPLVKTERTLFQSSRPDPPDTAPNYLPVYLIIGLAIAAALLVFGSLRARWANILFRTLAVFWTFTIGLLGLLITFLWIVTDHSVTYRNENALQANPLVLMLCVGLILVWLGRTRSLKFTVRTALVVSGLASLGLIIQLLPDLNQVNADIIALLLPAHVAIAWLLASGRAHPQDLAARRSSL